MNPRAKLIIELLFFGALSLFGSFYLWDALAGHREWFWGLFGFFLIIYNGDRFVERWNRL